MDILISGLVNGECINVKHVSNGLNTHKIQSNLHKWMRKELIFDRKCHCCAGSFIKFKSSRQPGAAQHVIILPVSHAQF